MTTNILRSYQVYGANDHVLDVAAKAVLDALKDAKSSTKVQRVALRRQGYRQDIEVGDVYIVPASVCDSPEDFLSPILYSSVRKRGAGEGLVEFQMGSLMDPDEITSESLKGLKDTVFVNSEGKSAPLIVFAPSWSNPADYRSFPYEGEDSLIPTLREVAYAAPFDPSLSSVFDQLKTVDPDMSPLAVNVPSVKHVFQIPTSEDPDYPKFAKGLDIAAPEGSKKASLGKKPVVRLTAADLPTAEKAVLGDDELSLFEAVDQQVGAAVKTAPEAAKQAAGLALAGVLPETYVDPDFARGESLRAQPDYGEAGTCADKTPDLVDGPSANAAAGLSTHQASFRIANIKTKQVWAAADVDGVKFGGDWSDDVTEAAAFTSKEAAEDEIRRNFLSRGEAEVVEEPCTCENCTCHRSASKQAKWKTAGNWYNPGSVLEQFAPDLAGSRVDSPFLGQQENEAGYINPFGAPGKEAPADNTGMGLNQQISDGAGDVVPLRQEMNFYGPDFARSFYAPHTDISPKSLKLKQPRAASQGRRSTRNTFRVTFDDGNTLNTGFNGTLEEARAYYVGRSFNFGDATKDRMAKGVGVEQLNAPVTASGPLHPEDYGYVLVKQQRDSSFTVRLGDDESLDAPVGTFPSAEAAVFEGLKAYVAQEGGFPELCSFQLTENFEPSVADADSVGVDGGPLPTAATGVMTVKFREGLVPTQAQAQALTAKLQEKLKAAGGKQASRKKADSNLSLFQGLSIADPETDGDFPDEHPQANFDERAPDGQTSIYEDPGPEVSMEDPLFLQMDQFVKQVLAAYASQLISAFQVTSRPISLGVPFEDTLDLADLIRYAGGPTISDGARDAAVAQLASGMGKLNDSQRRLLLENAFAQAAVWCNGKGASGGFNYEVYVRATEVGEATMKVTVVTGQKGAEG